MVNIPAPQNVDRDNDGLTDNVDRCPDQPGPISNQGCPLSDRDGDGVPDISDNCPDKAGSPSNKGCPEIPKKPQNIDTDNDGLTDNVDKCPNQAGPITNQGCPLSDKDKDGIPDITDKCPDKPGTAENEGCPENLYKIQEKIAAAKMTSDRDKDGILDVNDLCPDQAGPIANQGCPLSDTDGDGVADIADKCPDVSGSPTNGGCPEIVIKADTIKNVKFDSLNIPVDTLKFNIYFDLDKYSLTQNSFDVLGKIIQEMKQDAKYRCVLVGHSDTEGSAEYNLTLAKNRTGVAKSYIMSYGIGDARIVSKYVGETEPLPVASKELGWMNRRVAIYLYKIK
jgi:outer membrane protein OmpA-like peptidoglycan-associated protein